MLAHKKQNMDDDDYPTAAILTIQEAPPRSVGYLRIPGFMYASAEAPEEFARAVKNAWLTFVDEKCSKVIIDVRGNSGGVVAMGRALMHYLFPNVFPLYGNTDMVKTPISRIHAEYWSAQSPRIINDFLTYAPLADNWYRLTNPKPRSSSPTETSTRDWTIPFSLNDRVDDPFTALNEEADPKFLNGTTEFDPDDIFILTDGLCGSTCAHFINHIKETRVAKIVGLGSKTAVEKSKVTMGIAAFSSYTVFMHSRLADFQESGLDTTGLPDPLEWGSADLTISHLDLRSFKLNDGVSQASLEFKNYAPDILYDDIGSTDLSTGDWTEGIPEATEALLTDIVSQDWFFRCHEGMVKPAPDACNQPTANEVWGHPCARNEEISGKVTFDWDTDTCEFLRCEPGYYRSTQNFCRPIPGYEWEPAPLKRPTNSFWGTDSVSNKLLVIFGMALAAVGVLYLIIMSCIGCRRQASLNENPQSE